MNPSHFSIIDISHFSEVIGLFLDVEYLTMKHEMPEYIVPEMDNSDQNQQLQDQDQDQDMEATFIQETYEIIEDPSKSAEEGQLGDDNDMGESITQGEGRLFNLFKYYNNFN